MISKIDKEGTGKIDSSDFLMVMVQKMFEKDTQEKILKALKLLSNNKTWKMSFKNLNHVATELSENFTEGDLQEVIHEVD